MIFELFRKIENFDFLEIYFSKKNDFFLSIDKNQIKIDIVFEVFTKSIHQRFLIRTVFPKAERMRDVITQGVFSLRRNLNFRVCHKHMHLIRLISVQVWIKNANLAHGYSSIAAL